ncbi:MAG: thiamine pyrophosphate-binding protein [Burkholderiales bacterium]
MSAQRKAMHAGEAVAEALREEGVERVYSVPGSHIHPIYDGLSRVESIRFVTCKQEPNVSLMADAYGRITGKPGVCVVTAGPGGLNSMAGVAQAYGAASPMVHIGGAVPLKADMEAFHGVDDPAFVHEMFKHITKWSARVERIEDIPEVFAKAFHIARSGRPGPVHVELPRLTDYSEYILQETPVVLPPYKRIPPVVHLPDAQDVDRYARRLMEAKSPVIAAGKGILRRGAIQALADLASRLQAPVVCAQDTMGVLPETHPLFAGHFARNRSNPLADRTLKEADLVIAIGLRAGTAEMSELRDRAPRNLILIGFDSVAESRYRGDDERVADPERFLAAMNDRLGDFRKPRNDRLIQALADAKAAMLKDLFAQVEPHRDEVPIHPGILLSALRAVLDKDAVVASDVGNCQQWARSFCPINTPESLMQSGVWNAMSYALPTAIVAKMECPDREVVALAGDGAFLMTSGDLPTAAEYGANILMVVLNDGAFGQTFMQQTNIYGHTYGTTFRSPNYAQLAEACGAEGIRVTEPRDIDAALRAGLAATKERPALVEVMVADRPYAKLR